MTVLLENIKVTQFNICNQKSLLRFVLNNAKMYLPNATTYAIINQYCSMHSVPYRMYR